AGELHARLVDVGTQSLRTHLPTIPDTVPEPQVGEPTYAEKLSVDEFRLDPGRSAAELARVVRAGNPRPGAWIRVGDRRVKVWRAPRLPPPPAPPGRGRIRARGPLRTAPGAPPVRQVQPQSKPLMDAHSRARRGPAA